MIVGALTSGAHRRRRTSMTVVLMLPAIVVTLVLAVVWFGVEDAPVVGAGRIDLTGLGLLTLASG